MDLVHQQPSSLVSQMCFSEQHQAGDVGNERRDRIRREGLETSGYEALT